MDPATLLFALWLAYHANKWLWESGIVQAKTEVSRFREEVRRNVKEVREVVDRAGRSRAAGAGFAGVLGVWRGMQGAKRGAGARAREAAGGTGPVRRVARAAWLGARAGMREARTRHQQRRSGEPGTAGTRRKGGWRMPWVGACGDCGLPALVTALSDSLRGPWKACRQCIADSREQEGDSEPETDPKGDGTAGDETQADDTAEDDTAEDAEIVPDQDGTQPDGVTDPEQPGSQEEPAAPDAVPAAAQAAAPVAAEPAHTTGEPVTGTEISLPAGTSGGTGFGGSGGDSSTHGLWLSASAVQAARSGQAQEHMNAMASRLHSAQGGRSQVRDVIGWTKDAEGLITMLGGMVNAIDPGEQQFIAAIPGGDIDEMCEPAYYAAGGNR